MNTVPAPHSTPGVHRVLIAAGIIATFLSAVNISIPNAELLHIQGGLSMSDDEVGWIFSSYIAASAIVMPMTHWLAGRFGRKAIFQVSIAVAAISVLVRRRSFWFVRMLFGGIGVFFFVQQLISELAKH